MSNSKSATGRILLGTVALAAVMMLIVSCSDDAIDAADDASATIAESGVTYGMAFIVNDGTSLTRLSYSGKSTTFDDGDVVGCVVCTKSSTTDETTSETTESYVFKANSKWLYKSSTGRLVPNKLWTLTESTDDDGTTTTSMVESTLKGDTAGLLSYDDDGYTGTNSDDDLYLFFYHPFDSVGVTSTSWTSYPVSINTDQSTSDGRVASDFLYVAYTGGMHNGSAGTVSLTFAKETATVYLITGSAVENVKVVAYHDEDSENSTDTLFTGRYFNLSTGEYDSSSYPDDATITTSGGSSSGVTAQAYSFSNITSTNRWYALIPPQSAEGVAIAFNYKSDTDDTQLCASVADLKTIEAGKMYTVKVSAYDDAVVSSASATESTTVNGDFYSVTYPSSITLKYDNYGFTYDDTSYTYYLYQTTSGEEFFTLTLNVTTVVTLYYGNYSKDDDGTTRTNIGYYTSSDSGTWSGSYTTVKTSSDNVMDYSNDASSTYGGWLQFVLEAGTYKIVKPSSSGQEKIYLMTLSVFR